MSSAKKIVFSALCISLAVLLPLVFHAASGFGNIFLPMHLPVLLCGLLCGMHYGFLVGLIAPALSFFFTGIPPAAIFPGMLCELAAYGLLSGLFVKILPVRKHLSLLYAALILTMLCGRAIAGVLNAVIFMAGTYSFSVWLSASFVTGLPGILLQLVCLPFLVRVLKSASTPS